MKETHQMEDKNKRKYEENEERKLCEKKFKRATSKSFQAYLNDVKYVAFDFRDRKRLKFRVSFPELERLAKRINLFQSCALIQISQ